ncbi:hypothetical protein [Streptomyces sp. S.PB5]|uniref:hypothetical protein n=1 Tax=Streptomyces sp. S.PB5 TaxID=3020844 RepID=UPI0025B19B40|nr:hypothetical protein [Streptomyces sp. S.PB5]MDN3022046.1 hypothetical protein [Streptomyces sp. S.PB5]
MVLGSDLRRGNARRGRGPRPAGRGTAALAALVLLLAPAFVACSDDSGGGSESTPPTPTPEMTSSAPETSAPASGPADRAAAEKEVKENWEKFFDPKTSTKQKQAVLENGEAMGPVMAAFSGDERGAQVQAEVTEVEFTAPTKATVTYALLMNGATALPNTTGTAVEDDGTWKVSVSTLCALVALSGNASASALPGC